MYTKFQLNVLDRILLNSWLVFTWKNIANLLYEVSKYKMFTNIKKTFWGGRDQIQNAALS